MCAGCADVSSPAGPRTRYLTPIFTTEPVYLSTNLKNAGLSKLNGGQLRLSTTPSTIKKPSTSSPEARSAR